MEKRFLGNTGLQVSTIGFGAAPIGFLQTDQERVGRLLNVLLDGGMNLIDTAAAYHGSEEMIGRAVGHRRDDYVLVSKCGQSFEGLPGEPWTAEVIGATIDRSLKRLQTDRLDMMLLHTCEKTVLEKGEALGALVKAREAGKIRFAGFAGDNEGVSYAASLSGVAVVMASFNLVDQANIASLLPVAGANGAGIIAKRPIANAAWKSPEDQQGFYRNYAQPYHERFGAMDLHLTDFDVADWTELALRFTLSIPGVHAAVIGTTNPENAQRNLRAAERGPLSQDEIERIHKAFTNAGGKSWPALQ